MNTLATTNATPTLTLAESSSKSWLAISEAKAGDLDWLHNVCRDVRTISDAVASNAITLGRMARESGENGKKSVQAFVKLELIKLNAKLNLKESLSKSDINFIAEELTQGEYLSLNVADINLILDGIRKETFGKMYERISVAYVLSAVRQYFDERISVSEMENVNRAKKIKSSEPDISRKSYTEIMRLFEEAKIRRDSEQAEQRRIHQQNVAEAKERARRYYEQQRSQEQAETTKSSV